MRNTIKLLDKEAWIEIIDKAEEMRGMCYRKKLTPHEDEDEELSAKRKADEADRFAPMKLNKRPRKEE